MTKILSVKTLKHMIIHSVYDKSEYQTNTYYKNFALPNIQTLCDEDKKDIDIINFLSVYGVDEQQRNITVSSCYSQCNTYLHTVGDEFNIFYISNDDVFKGKIIMFNDIHENIETIYQYIINQFELDKSMYRNVNENLWYFILTIFMLQYDIPFAQIQHTLLLREMFPNLIIALFSTQTLVIFNKNNETVVFLQEDHNAYKLIYVNKSNNPEYIVKEEEILVLPMIII